MPGSYCAYLSKKVDLGTRLLVDLDVELLDVAVGVAEEEVRHLLGNGLGVQGGLVSLWVCVVR